MADNKSIVPWDDNSLDEVRQSIITAISDTTQNLVYSVLYDYCNALIAKNVDEKVALTTAHEIMQLWLNDSLKMRKRPAPRVPKPRQPKLTIDAKTASTRLSGEALPDNFEWVNHPTIDKLMYTTSFQLKTGYPVKNPEGKIVGVITETDLTKLTTSDVRSAASRGYNTDNNYLDMIKREYEKDFGPPH
jgi:CBS domain-containing protein